jgi:hypothetical protein
MPLSLENVVAMFVLALAMGATGTLAHVTPDRNTPLFTIHAARDNLLSDVPWTRDLSSVSTLSSHGLRVKRSTDGGEAIVDESLVRRGFLAASGRGFVDLSWDPASPSTPYVVARDGEPIANLTGGAFAFRDTTVAPGLTYRYTVVPEIPANISLPGAEVWSAQVRTPEEDGSSLSAQARALAGRAVAATTTLTWVTFIPEKFIDCPTVFGKALCTYGSGYEFGGDNHNFDWKSSSYRTVANAVVTWSSKSVAGYTGIGTTHVYEKKTGKLVAQKTASGADMKVYKLSDYGNSVDIRMQTHATNPFCPGGAIDGAFTMTLSQNGNWAIRSGEHRLMPNHYIYIYDGGRVTDVYRAKYASELCLVGPLTCDPAQLTGLFGTFS